MNTSEILNKAADLIEERGWWKDDAEMVGGFCAANAISESRGEGGIASMSLAFDALQSHLDVPALPDIWHWNDRQNSPAPVIEALRAAAVIEASRERQTVEVS